MYRALSPGAIGLKVSFEEAVKLAAAHGFQGIEVSMARVQELGLSGLQRLLKRHKLVASNTGMPVNFREDDAKFEEGLATLPEFCRAMAELDCRRVLTWLLPYHETMPTSRISSGCARGRCGCARCWSHTACATGWNSSARRRCARANRIPLSTASTASWT